MRVSELREKLAEIPLDTKVQVSCMKKDYILAHPNEANSFEFYAPDKVLLYCNSQDLAEAPRLSDLLSLADDAVITIDTDEGMSFKLITDIIILSNKIILI